MMDKTRLDRVGVVAGRGLYPKLVCRAAKENGVKFLGVVAINGDTDPAIADIADTVNWTYAGQLNKAIKLLKKQEIEHVIFAGQIKPSRLFTGLRPDVRAIKVLAGLSARNAESIFSSVANEFAKDGITVLPATTFLEDALADSGVIGKIKPGTKQLADIEFGRHIAFEVSRLDIGQTIVVKDGTVLAVEAFEGTDKAILRGGELGYGGVTVIKVSKPGQDMRFDIPCVGAGTVQSLITAKAKAIAVQAGMTLFLDKSTVVDSLNKNKIAVIGFDDVH